MKKLPLAFGTGMLSLALVLTGCADASAPTGETTTSSDTSSTATANDADEMFVTMMIPHHQQAIKMDSTHVSRSSPNRSRTPKAQRWT